MPATDPIAMSHPASPDGIRFFNTMTRKVEPFRPQVAGEVRMYTCGPTV